MRVAGAISGTSLDGIDVAILHFEKDFEVMGYHTVPYPPEIREAILAVSNADTHTAAIARLNYVIGELFAEAVKETCQKVGIPMASLNLIGSHGQTIFHEGDPIDYLGYSIASTMQIGEPAVIAKRTGVVTIADFRADDIAAGGKGAPLVPLLDWRMFRHDKLCRVALNIGGIANITVIPPGAGLEEVVAFDTGPGNMVVDALMGEAGFDRDGETARGGAVDEVLLEQLLADPYYKRTAPKTAGREQYGAGFVTLFRHLKREDAVATATGLTVRTIAEAVKAYHPDEVIVSGGGAHNGFLLEGLRQALGVPLKTSADFGLDIDAKEAIAFALLAYESFHGRPGNLPGATGAQRPVILGKSVDP